MPNKRAPNGRPRLHKRAMLSTLRVLSSRQMTHMRMTFPRFSGHWNKRLGALFVPFFSMAISPTVIANMW